ncbi:MAG: adenylate/guanylate cyclase domain-containing protein [Bacteroidota bacterium]
MGQESKSISRRRWGIIKFYVIGWTLSFIFLYIVRGVGTTENGALQFGLVDSMIISLTLGPIFGAVSGYAQILMEERIYKRISIQRLLILRLVYATLFLVLLTICAYGIYQLYFGTNIDLITFAFDDGSFAIYFYVLMVDLFMATVRQVNLMLGDNNLGRLLRGDFYTPREEERIFMFLDLQSSTQLAEKLGHVKYSTLIQDCFNDLAVVVQNEAQIYQYVGDEVVLTWPIEAGLRNHNCIKAYFNFMQQLSSKESYYQENYDCLPFFKAGMNLGVVTITEVGKYKKEIAYHGDTVNTAARIQGKCNELGEPLLISAFLKDKLGQNEWRFGRHGNISLKGKEQQVPIYSVSVN